MGSKVGLFQIPISSLQQPVRSPYQPAFLYRLWGVSLVVAVYEEDKL